MAGVDETDPPDSAAPPAHRTRLIVASVLYVCFVALLIVVIAFFVDEGLDKADKYASIFSLFVAMVSQVWAIVATSRAAASTNPRQVRLHRGRKIAVSLTVAGLVSFSCTSMPASSPPKPYSLYECSNVRVPEDMERPTPSLVDGLLFCPVQINDSSRAIQEPFVVSGQIVGVFPETRRVVLFVRIDPETCDTAGRAGGQGHFLLTQVDLSQADGGWSYLDDFGNYPPGITFRRIYEFASLSPESLQLILDRHDEWDQSGIAKEDMPTDVRFLSTFVIEPGISSQQVPCN